MNIKTKDIYHVLSHAFSMFFAFFSHVFVGDVWVGCVVVNAVFVYVYVFCHE